MNDASKSQLELSMKSGASGRKDNLRSIMTYNLIKNAIWNSVMDTDKPKEEQEINLIILNAAMAEMRVLIKFNHLQNMIKEKEQN